MLLPVVVVRRAGMAEMVGMFGTKGERKDEVGVEASVEARRTTWMGEWARV